MVGNSLRGQEKSKCLFFVLAMAEKRKAAANSSVFTVWSGMIFVGSMWCIFFLKPALGKAKLR